MFWQREGAIRVRHDIDRVGNAPLRTGYYSSEGVEEVATIRY
jgi:hypothetical protein